jgi:hypothetical protein
MIGRSAPGRRLVATIGLLLYGACTNPVAVDTLQRPSIVLVVPIDTRLFAPGGTLVAQIWSAEQLAALEKNAACTASRNSAGATEIKCPPGIQYQEVSPQEVRFVVRTAGARLEITPVAVRAGERFRIRVSGPSADKCNTTSGDQTLTAGSDSSIEVKLVWETTAKACGRGGMS